MTIARSPGLCAQTSWGNGTEMGRQRPLSTDCWGGRVSLCAPKVKAKGHKEIHIKENKGSVTLIAKDPVSVGKAVTGSVR